MREDACEKFSGEIKSQLRLSRMVTHGMTMRRKRRRSERKYLERKRRRTKEDTKELTTFGMLSYPQDDDDGDDGNKDEKESWRVEFMTKKHR